MCKISTEEIHVIRYDLALLNGLVKEICSQNEYIDAIIQMVDMDVIRQQRMHVILDPIYDVSRTSLQTIFLTARCEVNMIYERHDVLFYLKVDFRSQQLKCSKRYKASYW